MRWLFFWLLCASASGFLPAIAQDHIVQEFRGRGSTTTGLFKVQDRWEVRWNARQAVSVAVLSADGTIVAGGSGVLRGSLFVPSGGQYYLKISDGTTATAASTNTAPAGGTNTATAASTNMPYGVPPPVATGGVPATQPEPVESWHLQVVELGKSVASDQELSVYTPFFIVPDSAITPALPPPNVPPPALTNGQISAVVTVRGDDAQGAGFLMRSPDGTFVVTHLHLLAANPNVKIFTNTGELITPLSLKGAVDRDLALFAVRDDHFSYLPFSNDVATSFNVGDQVIIPDIGQQNGVLVGKPGKVIGMAPDRIDFDNALSPDSSGAPVIQVKNGKVLALVTSEEPVDVSANLAKAWPGNPVPGSESIISCYGLPLYGVQGWETYDEPRFLAETLFLKQFHEDTRCLDSYLNGKRHRQRYVGDETRALDNRYFLNNAKIGQANDSFKQLATGGDRDQQLDAARKLLFDLDDIADTGMSRLEDQNNLYVFDQLWARKELAYRKALKNELDDFGNNISQLESIAWSR
ncbi:MAG: serine protease [Methylacidiphilales bacterium]|nr:serine protease [Candidatus Methylacidiphilales bacterium]